MKKRRWAWLVLLGALAVGGWLASRFVALPFTVAEGYEAFGRPMNFPASSVVKDDGPAWRIDPGKPWRMEFGRGSGWHGLDTIELDREGRVVFHRLRHNQEDVLSWQTATAQLPPDAVVKVLEAVESHRLLELDKEYHADVHDGTQWVLWVRQGDRQKTVYFNNHFPDAILRFAESYDEIIAGTIGPGLQWRAVPRARGRDHERPLWASIQQ